MSVRSGEAVFTRSTEGYSIKIMTDDLVFHFEFLGDLDSAIQAVRGMGYLA